MSGGPPDTAAPVPYSRRVDRHATHGAAEPRTAPLVEAEAPRWDAFDPDAYVRQNYLRLHPADAAILRAGRDHLCRHFGRHGLPAPLTGIDVGTGANLYPTLMLLPWCKEITLLDFAENNVAWLRNTLHRDQSYGANWDPFWDVLRDRSPYAEITDPRGHLRGSTRMETGDVFELPEARWDIGTMFFTAESITASVTVFQEAVRCFVRSLLPGAPFAAAFMAESRACYYVGRERYPSCDVDEHTVAAAFGPYADGLRIRRFRQGHALRDGYEGMILACGRRRATR
ncbi:methyltransferase [Streptomyces sp. SID8111]|nr:SCO2525 family SAM-dependent methyltransferase [Streptomyces sp. SID8111]NEC30088.1 methyltransferase [Streptomyces sp. SID8111]